jgi:hypothetical protein
MDSEEDPRPCARRGCANAGTHRAPRARNALNDYLWFCLDHVREYNAAWNFCAGMSEAEMERRLRRDTVWERPSWAFGTGRFAPGGTAGANGAARRPPRFGVNGRVRLNDGFGTIFGEEEPARRGFGEGGNGHAANGHAGPKDEMGRALAVLGLEPPVTREALKARYKALAKRLHPDANGGDRAAEERLKDINLAYASLRKCDLIE